MKIYTHNEATSIIEEIIEPIIEKYGIIPHSPEDDDRDEDDIGGFYGSAFSNILDAVESNLIACLGGNKSSTEAATSATRATRGALSWYGFECANADFVDLQGTLHQAFKDMKTELEPVFARFTPAIAEERGVEPYVYCDEPQYTYVS